MTVDVKINAGMIIKWNTGTKLNTSELNNILKCKDYKNIIPYIKKHTDFVKKQVLSTRDDMELYNAIKENKDIKLVSSKKRGFYHTLTFKY